MRAALLTAYNKALELANTSDPTILAPDDVIVRVGAAGVCRTDLHLQDGQFDDVHRGIGLSLPFTCGHETAGWIEEVGPGVTHLKKGDAVLLHPVATCGHCRACRAGNDMHCTNSRTPGILGPGGFAEYMVTGARALVPIPEGLQPADVASFACAGLTVYHATKKAITLAVPGSYTVILGAGGLGHLAVQMLRALTASDIIVVDRSQAALDHASQLGADHIVLAKDDRSHIQEIRDIMKGGGAQVVFDCVGEHGVQNDAVQLLAANGVDFLIGYGGRLEFDILTQALFPETSFVGNVCGTYNDLVELLALARRGAVKLKTTTFGLEQINTAMDSLRAGTMVGRGVLVPGHCC
jgi:NAD+-dependent secondary alcohol dehydrogenase Adh1